MIVTDDIAAAHLNIKSAQICKAAQILIGLLPCPKLPDSFKRQPAEKRIFVALISVAISPNVPVFDVIVLVQRAGSGCWLSEFDFLHSRAPFMLRSRVPGVYQICLFYNPYTHRLHPAAETQDSLFPYWESNCFLRP